MSGLSGWLAGRLAGWPAGWLAGWLVGWLAGCLAGWLAGLLAGRLGRLAGRLADWLAGNWRINCWKEIWSGKSRKWINGWGEIRSGKSRKWICRDRVQVLFDDVLGTGKRASVSDMGLNFTFYFAAAAFIRANGMHFCLTVKRWRLGALLWLLGILGLPGMLKLFQCLPTHRRHPGQSIKVYSGEGSLINTHARERSLHVVSHASQHGFKIAAGNIHDNEHIQSLWITCLSSF